MANRNVEINTGDGANVAQIIATVVLPSSGTGINFFGMVTPVGGSPIAMTGSPATGPSAPGVGQSINYILQVSLTTGAVTEKQGAAANTGTQTTPSADAGNQAFFQGTLTNGQPNLLYGDTAAMPVLAW
ncbi:MAG TPA: hypothetical protein VKU00_18380 [Chthonomonadaceae bacterium]|nr:hypothetical protein [Chthonomonadaceae bacterium]